MLYQRLDWAPTVCLMLSLFPTNSPGNQENRVYVTTIALIFVDHILLLLKAGHSWAGNRLRIWQIKPWHLVTDDGWIISIYFLHRTFFYHLYFVQKDFIHLLHLSKMVNSVGFRLFVIMCVCFQQLYAQNNFMAIQNHIDKIMMNARILSDIVQAEMTKQGLPSGPGVPPSANVAYSSFVDEVEGRLRVLEDTTASLTKQMNRCPNAPARKYQ